MLTITERNERKVDLKVCLSTTSFKYESDSSWYNCLYLSFLKEDFPNFNYPDIRELFGRPQFDYVISSFAGLCFHGGITFYKEKLDKESSKTIIKIGCDYQHYGDEAYMARDWGEDILKYDAEYVLKEFLELHETLSNLKKMTHEQINEALAVKVMGRPLEIHREVESLYAGTNQEWNPMGNLSQAMECLEKIDRLYTIRKHRDDFHKWYEVDINFYDTHIGDNDQSLSEIICHAIMKVIG